MPCARVDVSVVIPCFNQGRFLRDAVESVLGQRGIDGAEAPRVEAIVVNDGSTDDTRAVAAQYAGRVAYIETSNRGAAAARNRGILEARGAFLHSLDADDWIAPDFYGLLLAAARQRPDVDVFFGTCLQTDEAKRPLWLREAQPLADADPLHALLRGNHFACHALLLRREALALAGLFNPELTSMEDWDLWLRLAARCAKFLPVPQAQCVYRRSENSQSRQFERQYWNGVRILQMHRRHHGRCGQCRRAARAGRRHHLRYALEGAYWHTFGRLRQTQGLASALRFMARTSCRDPAIFVEVCRHLAGRGWRRNRKPAAAGAGIPQVTMPGITMPAVAMEAQWTSP